ncbi:hypothetical protein [Desulfobulbus alkaliphilus]|uniref:hypothetical protein n=1 Tax=Desulfobulbus alkaliphilus TaxID=869814 RepID=UPI001964EBE1|nr:hypothetical protein [Desulfobulbus alkaliphilus]MBM9535995.1 hypothetical protein [Desulfobulbus alkaliphilus]
MHNSFATSLSIRVAEGHVRLYTDVPAARDHFSSVFSLCRCVGRPKGPLLSEYGIFFQGRNEVVAWCSYPDSNGSDRETLYAGSSTSAVWVVDHEMIKRTVLRDSDCAALHAAWVSTGNAILILAGDGGSGKSSLCLELLLLGCGYGAEDVTFFQGPNPLALPRAVLLKPGSALRSRSGLIRLPSVLEDFDGRAYCLPQPPPKVARYDQQQFVFMFLEAAGSGTLSRLGPTETVRRFVEACQTPNKISPLLFERVVKTAREGRSYVVRGRLVPAVHQAIKDVAA